MTRSPLEPVYTIITTSGRYPAMFPRVRRCISGNLEQSEMGLGVLRSSFCFGFVFVFFNGRMETPGGKQEAFYDERVA